ncbi:hypothetical protein X797_011704 [Metarhizium robertsii]|uniref:Uncharacterized protein n=1 Tax=Metarhizium robertsii TaxID=568076 RepID=A0A0A1UMR8_9HYPO|nr:hypothetical protein X797_011704 [Metarhizium robertsii]
MAITLTRASLPVVIMPAEALSISVLCDEHHNREKHEVIRRENPSLPRCGYCGKFWPKEINVGDSDSEATRAVKEASPFENPIGLKIRIKVLHSVGYNLTEGFSKAAKTSQLDCLDLPVMPWRTLRSLSKDSFISDYLIRLGLPLRVIDQSNIQFGVSLRGLASQRLGLSSLLPSNTSLSNQWRKSSILMQMTLGLLKMEEPFFGLIYDLLKISQFSSQKILGLNLKKEAG